MPLIIMAAGLCLLEKEVRRGRWVGMEIDNVESVVLDVARDDA